MDNPDGACKNKHKNDKDDRTNKNEHKGRMIQIE